MFAALIVLVLPCFLRVSLANPVTSFDDIVYWVGSGANRSAIVVDWDETSENEPSLVWGYRWDGSATGNDLFRAVVEADSRLFAKLGAGSKLGVPLYGIGYDLNDDGQFGISDGTDFGADGLAETGIPDSPPCYCAATSVDPDDHYAEGWFTGFWHQGVSTGNPFAGGQWSEGRGLAVRSLSDGSWDSWTFSSPSSTSAFAGNPHAAEPPASFFADFEPDGDVDSDDLTIWQLGFGRMMASRFEGDADRDGDADGDDFLLWQREFGAARAGSLSGAALASNSVPEPATWPMGIVLSLVFCVLVRLWPIGVR